MSHQKFNRKHTYRSLILGALLLSGISLASLPVFAASPTPGTVIENQATGSFVDESDNSNQTLLSDKVTLIVGEVAGITVTANVVTGTASPGATVYYSFIITNVGNDPTQFFIPSAANITSGNATQPSNIEITSYNLDGTTSVNTSVVVPTGGKQTGSNGTVAGLLGSGSAGVLLPGGSVTVRVPVLINATATGTVDVQLGDTPVDSTSVTTPQARLENQAYIAGSNDVYTVDNPDSLETSTGLPINGDATNHRQEAAAVKSALVIAIDYGDAPDTYKTLAASGGPSHTISSLYLGASVTGEANGQPNATATGDTGDDGVTFSPTYGSNYSTLVQEGVTNNVDVVSSGAGFLNAWIDYNQNGVFDPGELVFSNKPVVAGINHLTFVPPSNLLHGNTYARFRLSPTSIATPLPTGAVTGGEVEDYQVQVATPIPDGASCSNTGLLNGGFETPPVGLNTFNIQSKSLYPGWNTTATDQMMESWGSGYQGFSSFSGSYFAEMNANQKASLYQDIATVPGSILTYQFAHRARSLPPTTPAVLVDTAGVSAGAPGAVVSLRTFSTDSTDWVVYRGTYTVPAGQYITRFQFDSVNAGIQQVSGFATNNSFGNFIDAVQFSTSGCVTPISPPTIDLDGDNSTTPGNNYQNTFVVGGSAVAAADTDVAITDDKTNITRAIAQLTNPLDGANESLTFNTALAATFGITIDQAYNSTSGTSTTGRITLKGTATLAQYQQVIATLKYANTKASPTMTDRIINVEVVDSDKAISNTAVSTIKMSAGPSIAGTVFEDPNYGGGAGRPLSTPATSGRDSATVELYSSTGTYLKTTTTSGGGKYSFTGIAPGDYKVRVVNSTVTSSRPGYVAGLLPVQTFRTDAGTVAGTVTAVTDHVGGEIPKEIDAPANTTATLTTLNAVANQEVQSLTVVKVGAIGITGIDFGYNFDTIVNTNDAGQGSLRQFIINSNALTNGGLDQVANPSPAPGTTAVDPAAGEETSIFMIPASALTSNVAVITPTSLLPTVTDSFTTITGATQTINIGDTNSGQQGAGGPVGVDVLTLSRVDKPEVQIVGGSSFASGIKVSGANTTIRGLSIYGFGAGTTGSVLDANIVLANNTANTKIEQNFLGSTASSFSIPAAGTGSDNIYLGDGSTNAIVQNNLIGFANFFGLLGTGAKNLTFQNNEVRQNSYNDPGKDGLSLEDAGNTNNLIQGNLFIDQGGNGIDSYNSSGGLIVKNNTVTGNGVGSNGALGETPGIRLYGTGNTVYRNIIFNNYGPGVMVTFNSKQGTISQNSIYGNGTILAKNGAAASGQIGIDLLLSGEPDQSGTSPYVSANDGAVATGGNNGMDYPVISSSSLSAGTLTVSGYVGNNAAGSATFANATLEFFISEGTGQNLGEVIVGDGKSKSHGEGKTYIGSCTADGSGLFTNCTFANAGTLGLTNAQNITATATNLAGNTSEFSAPGVNNANVLLVKRITGINGNRTKNPNDNTPLNTFVDDTTSPHQNDDNSPNWKSNYLIGAIDAGKVKPGDEIEYTVYFLNAGGGDANGVRICDLITPNQVFKVGAYGTSKDVELGLGNNGLQYLTGANDGLDRTQLYAPNATVPNNCYLKDPNTDGTLLVDVTGAASTGIPAITTVPGATAPGAPNDSYGFIRFTTKVNP